MRSVLLSIRPKRSWTSCSSPTTTARAPVARCKECKHYREAPSQTSDNAVVV